MNILISVPSPAHDRMARYMLTFASYTDMTIRGVFTILLHMHMLRSTIGLAIGGQKLVL